MKVQNLIFVLGSITLALNSSISFATGNAGTQILCTPQWDSGDFALAKFNQVIISHFSNTGPSAHWIPDSRRMVGFGAVKAADVNVTPDSSGNSHYEISTSETRNYGPDYAPIRNNHRLTETSVANLNFDAANPTESSIELRLLRRVDAINSNPSFPDLSEPEHETLNIRARANCVLIRN